MVGPLDDNKLSCESVGDQKFIISAFRFLHEKWYNYTTSFRIVLRDIREQKLLVTI